MKTLTRAATTLTALLTVVGCDAPEAPTYTDAAEALTEACLDICADDEDCNRCEDASEGLTVEPDQMAVVAAIVGIELPPEPMPTPDNAASDTLVVPASNGVVHYDTSDSTWNFFAARTWALLMGTETCFNEGSMFYPIHACSDPGVTIGVAYEHPQARYHLVPCEDLGNW